MDVDAGGVAGGWTALDGAVGLGILTDVVVVTGGEVLEEGVEVAPVRRGAAPDGCGEDVGATCGVGCWVVEGTPTPAGIEVGKEVRDAEGPVDPEGTSAELPASSPRSCLSERAAPIISGRKGARRATLRSRL